MIFAGYTVAIKGVLAGAVTTSQLPITGGYTETTQAGVVTAIAQIHTVTNSTTAVTIVSTSGSVNNRKLQGLSVVNIDTAAATFTLYADDGSDTRTILKVTLEVGDQLTVADDGSWAVKDLNGDIHTSGSAPADADYLVKTANGNLSAERVVTDTATVIVDWATAGQAKFNVGGASTLYGALDALTVTGANVASATTTDIGAATGESLTITGTTTITGLGTKTAGVKRFVTFSGALILTHNATTLILPTAANITTVAGDTAVFLSLGSGNWKCLDYTRASGTAIVGGSLDIVGLTAGDLAVDDESPFYDLSATSNKKATISRLLGFTSSGLCEGRLTLESGVSVSTTDQAGKTNIYFTPHVGDRISIYDGTRLRLYVFTELTLALGTLTSGKPYDVFIYDNSGTLTLESLAWTNDTTRATALVRQNGAWYKTGALTRRYLGTFYTTATTTTEDSAAKRFLFNAHNPVKRILIRNVSGNWNYTTQTFRQANATAANRVECVIGLPHVDIEVKVLCLVISTSNVFTEVGVGVDSTSVDSSTLTGDVSFAGGGSSGQCPTAFYNGYPGIGYHALNWIERSDPAGTTTWYGDLTGTGIKSGMLGSLMG